MMIPAITHVNGIFNINTSALEELIDNNCTMPNIDRVVYNLKMDGRKLEDGSVDPVLTTVIFFIDGTKSIVKNSVNDKVIITEHTLSDGTTVMVADRESKERGLVYGIMKRLVSRIDENGNSVNGALGISLKSIIDTAQDNIIDNAEIKVARAANKKKHIELQTANKNRPKRYSIHETLDRLNSLLDQITIDKTSDGGCCGGNCSH